MSPLEIELARRVSERFDSDFLRAFGATTSARADTVFTLDKLRRIEAAVKALGVPAPVTIYANVFHTKTVEDWSRVRSIGRATRRRKQGHRQNVVIREVPREDFLAFDGKLIGHPVTIAKLHARIAAHNTKQEDKTNG